MVVNVDTFQNQLTYDFQNPGAEEKLRELIVYISKKCAGDPYFGATMLNKILFYSDFWAFAQHGTPITGIAYQRLPNGPAPKRLLPVRESMQQSGDIDVVQVPFHGYAQHRTEALRDPDTSKFKSVELRMVDTVISILSGNPAGTISELSHGLAWSTAKEGELIPYQAAFVSDELPNEADVAWAGVVSGELGLHA